MARRLLDDDALERELLGLPAWERRGNAIHRVVQLASAREALRLIARIGDAAEGADHHPDLRWSYRTVAVSLTTHDAGGLTSLDVRLARVVDDVVAELAVGLDRAPLAGDTTKERSAR